jgi:hypothetical protein
VVNPMVEAAQTPHSRRICSGVTAQQALVTCAALAQVLLHTLGEGVTTMLTILLVVVLIAALASAPAWPYSRGWGYYPSGGLGIVVVVLLVLMFSGRI